MEIPASDFVVGMECTFYCDFWDVAEHAICVELPWNDCIDSANA